MSIEQQEEFMYAISGSLFTDRQLRLAKEAFMNYANEINTQIERFSDTFPGWFIAEYTYEDKKLYGHFCTDCYFEDDDTMILTLVFRIPRCGDSGESLFTYEFLPGQPENLDHILRNLSIELSSNLLEYVVIPMDDDCVTTS